MKKPGDNVSAVITAIAAAVAMVVAVVLPLTFFYSFLAREKSVLETEAEINARIASAVVNANPELWRFQTIKLEEFLQRRSRHGHPEIRRIVDIEGKTIAESLDPLGPPLLWASAYISDAGLQVAEIRVGRSLRPLIFRTVGVAFVSLLLAAVIFVVLRIWPLRALDRALAENRRLVDTLEQRLAEITAAQNRLASLYEIGFATSGTLNVQEVLRLLMDKIALFSPNTAVQVWLADSKTGSFESAACSNMDEARWKRRKRDRIPKLVEEAVTHKKPVIVRDVRTDPRTMDPEFFRDQGFISYIGLPMVVRGNVLGDLVLVTREEHSFADDEIAFLTAIANQAAVAVCNSQLYEKTLRQADDLKRSNAELEQFAYVASHDLQEPLRMVAGYTGLLAKRYKGKLDQEADQFIDFAVDGAKRMQQLINDLLVYSRLGTRGKELVPTDCELVFSKTLAGLGMAVQESGAKITHDSLPMVVADGTQLGQLFQNLISNGIKYRNSKPPEIHLSCSKDGDHWLFSAKDNGIGIDPKFSEKIFELFHRLHTREEFDGTGIGLAVCKRIVERHGGRIWVESALGEGATFYFTLPAC